MTCVNGRCNFFKWAKTEFDARNKSVINGLLRRLKNNDDECFDEMIKAKEEYKDFYSEELSEAQKQARNWKYFAVLLFVFHCWSTSVGRDGSNDV